MRCRRRCPRSARGTAARSAAACAPACSASTTGSCPASAWCWESPAPGRAPAWCSPAAWRDCWPARCSMAAGEYISVRSQREMYEYQIGLEREELAEYPDEEAEELALIYTARGVDAAQARVLSQTLLARPEQALDVLAREELGLNPDDLGSSWQAGGTSFVAFAAGAAVPLLPFLAGAAGFRAIQAAVVVTLAALFGAGLVLSLFTGRDALRSGARMVLIGAAAGAVTYLLGRALGVVIG